MTHRPAVDAGGTGKFRTVEWRGMGMFNFLYGSPCHDCNLTKFL